MFVKNFMIEHCYIHIPFCLRKCNYCSFVSGEDVTKKDIYLSALKKEIKRIYKKDILKTLYIGGGTPSLLESRDIEGIVQLFSFEPSAEITLEANPETVTESKFKAYRDIGINRISLGVQTFNSDTLKLIGRKHEEKDIYNAAQVIKSAGFSNISIDLIYGLPSQTAHDFKSDLKKAVDLGIKHISTYGLKIEENSFFGKNPPSNLPDDDIQAQIYLMSCEFLKENGFEHYEISSFSKKNYFSQHNTAYWKNKNYYGFGLNASGYEENLRYKNISDFEKYTKNPLLKEEETTLTGKEILEEEIFLALRLKEGVNIEEINKKFGIDFEEKYAYVIKKYEKTGLLKIKKNHCFLTEAGFLLSNNIMCEFI